MGWKLQFKISSALKNIIGKELITDKYVAIFELVKNSFDAYAEKVDINFFEDKIVIKDNGKGMNLNDIKNKWLAVAYSAKADNTEDRGYGDFRNKIKTRKSFAGAKWIWRFACDRLWKRLKLISIKEEKEPKVEQIIVEWGLFEHDSKENFVDIKVMHETLQKNPYSKIKNWTILEITELREQWGNPDITKLEQQIGRLINPINNKMSDSFKIYINWKKVENFIFEKLWIKTTNIHVNIKNDGKQIFTKLEDRWDMIYEITEENNQYKEFFNKWIEIDIKLYYLNRPAKLLFKKDMWIDSVSFWSTFVYKNGFRIYPYGEHKDDSFWIDRRKAQWHSRYLWLRDLIWIIEISSETRYFQETTSRDGGFIKNNLIEEFKEFLISIALRRLEVYTVDTLDWTYILSIEEEVSREDRKDSILNLVKKITKAKNVINSKINEKLIYHKINEEKDKWWINKAKKIANISGNKELSKELEKVEKVIKKSLIQKNEAEKEKDISNLEKKQIKKDKDEIESRLYFHQWLITEEKEDFLDYFHQIWINTETIKNTLKKSIKLIQSWSEKEKVIEIIQKAYESILRTLVITKFATKANFKADFTEINEDLIGFIQQYVENIITLQWSSKINIEISWNKLLFKIKFIPIKIAIILDNLLSNSKKASANNILIHFSTSSNQLQIIFSDDWGWISENDEKIFDFWFTTTYWSWIGLHTVRKYMQSDFNWNIEIYKWKGNHLKWAIFILTFNQ